jgi:hypothetical protein
MNLAACFLLHVGDRHNINVSNIKKNRLQKREGKRRKLRRLIWMMYFLYKNE